MPIWFSCFPFRRLVRLLHQSRKFSRQLRDSPHFGFDEADNIVRSGKCRTAYPLHSDDFEGKDKAMPTEINEENVRRKTDSRDEIVALSGNLRRIAGRAES